MNRRNSILRGARAAGFMIVGASSLLAASLAASCADSEAKTEGPDAAPTVIPGLDAAGDAVADGRADGECAEGDGGATCASYDVPCSETEWCPFATVADSRRALTSIWGSSKNDVWVVGAAGSVIHWDGTSWSDASTGTTYTLFGVGGSGPSDVWTVSTPAIFFHGGKAGSSVAWTPMPTLAPMQSYDPLPALTSVWAASPDDVWIGGGDKINFPIVTKLWHKIRNREGGPNGGPDGGDGGTVWQGVATCQYNGDCAIIRSIWGSSASDVWAVGDRGKSYHTTKVSSDVDIPTVFDQLETQANEALGGVWGTDAANVWAVGDRGTIRHHGATTEPRPWEVVASPTQEDLRAVWGSSPSDVWAVGDHGIVLHFDGSNWKVSPVSLPVGPKPNLYGIWGSAADDVWVVGEGIVLRFTERRAGSAEGAP